MWHNFWISKAVIKQEISLKILFMKITIQLKHRYVVFQETIFIKTLFKSFSAKTC
jgi:hypothetical protein